MIQSVGISNSFIHNITFAMPHFVWKLPSYVMPADVARDNGLLQPVLDLSLLTFEVSRANTGIGPWMRRRTSEAGDIFVKRAAYVPCTFSDVSQYQIFGCRSNSPRFGVLPFTFRSSHFIHPNS